MKYEEFPVIDPVATGQNILSLRKQKGLTVRDLQKYFGFEEPQAIYRWQYGKTLPSVDNLYALSVILGVSMESILVPIPSKIKKQQEIPAAYIFLRLVDKKVCIDNAYFFFFFRFPHNEDYIRFIRIFANCCLLSFAKVLQIVV